MNRLTSIAVLSFLAMAGCTSTESTSPSTEVASTSQRDALVGTWSGSLDSGASVRVRIPASGNASYSFKGQSVSVSATRMSGRSMILTVGSGGGSVTLTPNDNGLAYSYSFRGDRASTTLAKS